MQEESFETELEASSTIETGEFDKEENQEIAPAKEIVESDLDGIILNAIFCVILLFLGLYFRA